MTNRSSLLEPQEANRGSKYPGQAFRFEVMARRCLHRWVVMRSSSELISEECTRCQKIRTFLYSKEKTP